MVRLDDIADLDVGYAFKSDKFTTDPQDRRLLRGDNIAQGVTRWDHTAYWPSTEHAPDRYELLEGDVVLAMDRPWIGAGLKFARINAADLPALLVQRVARLRAKPGNHQGYLGCVIGSNEFTEHVLAVQTGTSIPHISGTQIADYRLRPHGLADQRAIAEVKGVLDDKIAANIKLIAVADELSRVVFTSMLNETETRPLTSVADFVNGKAFTKDASGCGRVVIRIAELNSGLGGSTVYNDIEVADQHLARPGDLLFAWSGSLTLHRWFRAEGIINQHIFKVLPKDGYPTWCVSALLVRKLDEFKGIAADKATTMGHIQRRHLDEPVEVPVAAQIERNDALMASLWKRALAAEEESLGLVAMRDALLPQLMSGRIRVRDAVPMLGEEV